MVVLAVVAIGILSACTKEPAGKVSISAPADLAKVVSPFKVQMAAQGVTVEPASAGVNDGRGHHHVIIDDNLSPKGQPIPSDVNRLQFGKGQSEATLDLAPGEHTIRLFFAKGDHIPYDPIITSSIKGTVTEQRKVSFSEPAIGAQVISPFIVKMAAQSLVVEPATAGIHEGAGHHYIIVDADLPTAGQPIPSDAQHLHFGKAQTEATLDLAPGKHTLRLVFADGNHSPYDPAVTSAIEVTVTQQRKVSFLEPSDGAQIASTFTVKMGATGLVVEPATAGVHEGGGHHLG
ncbi:MAG: DUF4399 domain-containing protein [Dehalococcoidia bacterium]|nr:DUF4399 domain-containing protein [Dehalococcoidia bacterium]